jgi:superoxide reductase
MKKLDIAKKDDAVIEILLGETDGFEILEEKTADSSQEKHVPFIKETENGYLVKVGETVDHPMADAHYIQFIELVAGDRVYRKYLNPGDKPEAEFTLEKTEGVYAREYCNLHGLWKG